MCEKIKNVEYQQMCFDGLAHQIHPLTNGSSVKTIQLCNLMPSIKWNNFCITVNAGASYAVGDRDVPFKICAETRLDGQEDCYNRVFSNIGEYRKLNEAFKTLCYNVSEPEWRKKCEVFN